MILFKQYFKQWQSFKKNKTFKIINAHTTVGVATMPMFMFLAILGQFKGLFTWRGGPRSSGVGFFCFHALGDTKQKKLTPRDRGPPLHVNRP